MALLRVLQQEKYILQNTKLPNRKNVLSARAKNKEVGEKKIQESSVAPFGTFLQDEMST